MEEEKSIRVIREYQKQDNLIGDMLESIEKMEAEDDIRLPRSLLTDIAIRSYTNGYSCYSDDLKEMATKDILLKQILDSIDKIEVPKLFQLVFYHYTKGNDAECKEAIHKLCITLKENEKKISEDAIFELFLAPLKNAPEEIWEYISHEVKELNGVDGISEFCELISLYYGSSSNDEVMFALKTFLRKYPEYKIVNEMLGYTYYNMSMWNESIECLEKVTEQYYYNISYIYFMLAWSYGEIGNLTEEEKYYRKSLESNSDVPFALNNLGYCLYKQEKYQEALDIFEECLEMKKEIFHVGTNYVRTLIALGRNKDAKDYIIQNATILPEKLKEKDVILETQCLVDIECVVKVTLDIGIQR